MDNMPIMSTVVSQQNVSMFSWARFCGTQELGLGVASVSNIPRKKQRPAPHGLQMQIQDGGEKQESSCQRQESIMLLGPPVV